MNRLHRDLVGLISGGAPQALTAVKAKALLARVRPRDEMGRLRRRLAADQLADLVALDKRLAAAEAEIQAMVKRTRTGLPDIYGIGPVTTATIIGEVGDVARFGDHHFASYNGTAAHDKGSAGRPVHCVNLKGNRRLNHAIHMAAITQIRNRRSPAAPTTNTSSPRPRPTRKRCVASSGASPMSSTANSSPTPDAKPRRAREGKRGRLCNPA